MRKGFTLIELLAVIVILAVIALIATPIVVDIINDTDESATLRSADFYLKGVELSIAQMKAVKNLNVADGKYSIMEDGNICIGVLENNTCDGEILKVEVKGEKPNSGYIEIANGGIENIDFTISDNRMVKNSNGETIHFPCVLEDGYKNIEGSLYSCEVKNGVRYNFYVLSHNDDGTTNLIMERNMSYDFVNDVGLVATEKNRGLVAWYENLRDHSYGPVTAMNYLHNATKDWDNVPNMIMNYEDENIDYTTGEKGTSGYGSIKTTGTTTIITSKNNEETGRIENLKTRMPRYDEVHGENKCLTHDENGYGSCPLWLANYMISSEYVTGEGLQNISGISGYWTLSSAASHSHHAWRMRYYGYVSTNSVASGSANGVRPVITLKL